MVTVAKKCIISCLNKIDEKLLRLKACVLKCYDDHLKEYCNHFKEHGKNDTKLRKENKRDVLEW